MEIKILRSRVSGNGVFFVQSAFFAALIGAGLKVKRWQND